MATVLWDAEETVLTEYLEHGSTIIETYYADLSKKVAEARRKDERTYSNVISSTSC